MTTLEPETPPGGRSSVTDLLKKAASGMDLTRMSLPAWVLADVSYLEVRHTLISYPELFSSIALGETPLERMKRVVTWFVSGFCSRSSVKRKPMNPILGEQFLCSWTIDDGRREPITMAAEQVSHHPPVSAFYAEDHATGTTLNGYLAGKPKFLGNSVRQANTGYSVLHVPVDGGEDYVIKEPSIYIRGILTFKFWKEFCDEAVITCEETGMEARFEFHAKPMFRGDYNVLSGKIVDNGEEVFVFKGKWDGDVVGRPAGTKKGVDDQVLFSLDAVAPTDPIVAPVEFQEENESRRVWHELIEALRAGEYSAASTAKNDVEEAEREKRRLREADGIEWVPELFEWDDYSEMWVYIGHRLRQKYSESVSATSSAPRTTLSAATTTATHDTDATVMTGTSSQAAANDHDGFGGDIDDEPTASRDRRRSRRERRGKARPAIANDGDDGDDDDTWESV